MAPRALVVDNDFFFVEFLSCLLAHRGYEVIKTYDGKEAIGWLERESFDLLFLDMVIPKINGPKLIEYVRARFSPPGFPIVALSGTIIERLDELGDIGADYYIVKGPIEKMEVEINRFLMEFEHPDFGSKTLEDSDRFFEPKHLYPRQETAELMEAVEFHRSIIESLAPGVLVLDRDTRLFHANPAALRILELGLEDLLNRTFTSLFVQEDRPLLIGALKDLLTGRTRDSCRMSALTAAFLVSLNLSVLKVRGTAAGWVVVVEAGVDG